MATITHNSWMWTRQPPQASKTMSRALVVPHQFLGTARTRLLAPCTRPPCFRAEKVHQQPSHTPSIRTFPHQNNHHIRHAGTEVQKNVRPDPTLRRWPRRTRQAKPLLRKNYAKQRDSPFVEMMNNWIQEPWPLILVVITE
jgi:hypothetical protein